MSTINNGVDTEIRTRVKPAKWVCQSNVTQPGSMGSCIPLAKLTKSMLKVRLIRSECIHDSFAGWVYLRKNFVDLVNITGLEISQGTSCDLDQFKTQFEPRFAGTALASRSSRGGHPLLGNAQHIP